MDIKPIQTCYNGYKFRSRLEARWAVFFDDMGIKYEYESEGYLLQDGTKYLPDFIIYVRHRSWLDEWEPVYVEVKGQMSPNDLHKIDQMSKEVPVIVLGKIPFDVSEYFDIYNDTPYMHSFRYIDGDEYPAAFSIYKNCPWICGPDHDEWDGGKAMRRSFLKARQARFEHGETPCV